VFNTGKVSQRYATCLLPWASKTDPDRQPPITRRCSHASSHEHGVAVVCVLGAVVAAQADCGRITGVVTDPSAGVLPGVTVTLSDTQTRSAVTNERGEFAFDSLLPGTYVLRAALQGYRELTRQVSVDGGRTLHLALQIEVGALQETLSLTAEQALPSALQGGSPAATRTLCCASHVWPMPPTIGHRSTPRRTTTSTRTD